MNDLTLSDYVQRSKERALATLFDWLRIPSISADPERAVDVARSAEFCAGLLRESGLQAVEVLWADGGGLAGTGSPAVYGDG